MRATKITLAVGLALIVAGIGYALSRAPVTVARVNTSDGRQLGSINEQTVLCQSGEQMPRGTTAIRLRLFSYTGPRVTLSVLDDDGALIARGERGAGWTGGVVTVPVSPLSGVRRVKLCFTLFIEDGESDYLAGELTQRAPATINGTSLPGRVGIEFLRPSRSPWLSIVPDVARRMGLGNAGSGLWNAVLVIALMTLLGFVTVRLLLRELR